MSIQLLTSALPLFSSWGILLTLLVLWVILLIWLGFVIFLAVQFILPFISEDGPDLQPWVDLLTEMKGEDRNTNPYERPDNTSRSEWGNTAGGGGPRDLETGTNNTSRSEYGNTGRRGRDQADRPDPNDEDWLR